MSLMDPNSILATTYKDAALCYGVLSLIHYRYNHTLPDDHMRQLVVEAMEAAALMQKAPAGVAVGNKRCNTCGAVGAEDERFHSVDGGAFVTIESLARGYQEMRKELMAKAVDTAEVERRAKYEALTECADEMDSGVPRIGEWTRNAAVDNIRRHAEQYAPTPAPVTLSDGSTVLADSRDQWVRRDADGRSGTVNATIAGCVMNGDSPAILRELAALAERVEREGR